MAKIELECEIAHKMYILLLAASATQDVIHRNLVIAPFKEVHAWLSVFMMLFVRQIFVVNHIIKSFDITFNMKRKNQLWLSVIWGRVA